MAQTETTLNAAGWAVYLEARQRHFAQLVVSEKARLGASILLDSDYDRIAGWMAEWRERWLWRFERVAPSHLRSEHACGSLCPEHGDVRDTSAVR